MLHPYWDYFIEKPWDYTLYPEAIHSNIFCYGKTHSGRTQKVAKPVMNQAIQAGRSCIVYAEKSNEKYAPIKNLALQNGYRLVELNAATLDTDETQYQASKIAGDIHSGTPTLVLISNTNFRQRGQKTVVDELMATLQKNAKPEPYKYCKDRSHSPLVVLDGLCGNMSIPRKILRPNGLQFCIIMDSQVAYFPWLKSVTHDILVNRFGPNNKSQEIVEEFLPIILQEFFADIETVICTGINGVKPEMHRQFVGQCIFDVPTIKIGGRFIAMENPPEKAIKNTKSLIPGAGTFKKVAINEDTIETSVCNEIAEGFIRPDVWILEQDGKPSLYFDGEIYGPILFPIKEAAMNWTAIKLNSTKMELLNLEEAPDMVRYECCANSQKTELFLTRIDEQDAENYRLIYLLCVLERAEYDDLTQWLQTEEAIAQGYNPEDGIESNVKKYYANIEAEAAKVEQQPAGNNEEGNALPPIPPIEPYWEKFCEKDKQATTAAPTSNEPTSLPEQGVLFLGGHWNMVKKIQQKHPGWLYITDDKHISAAAINVKYVFYWTNHSSHKMTENIFSRLTPEAEIMYVTATNMDRLENEMRTRFIENKNRKRRTETNAT